jgi:hypothetical protein
MKFSPLIEKISSETVVEYSCEEIKSKYYVYYYLIEIFASFIVFKLYGISWILVFILSLILCINILQRYIVVEESALIIRDFGIQLRRKYWSGNEKVQVLTSNISQFKAL